MTVNCIKKQWALLFFILMPHFIWTQCFNAVITAYHLERLKKEPAPVDIDDKLIQDLIIVADNCYQKILKITALYFSGILMESDRLYQDIIFEITKHILEAGQLVAIYLSELLQSPNISVKQKVKRCSYVLSFLAAIVFWMRNIYNPKNATEPTADSNLRSLLPDNSTLKKERYLS